MYKTRETLYWKVVCSYKGSKRSPVLARCLLVLRDLVLGRVQTLCYSNEMVVDQECTSCPLDWNYPLTLGETTADC